MKVLKVKRNNMKELADEGVLGYTHFSIKEVFYYKKPSKKNDYFSKVMQYKIPLQIENEDTIVAGLSIRQLVVMMMWGGVGYAIFRALEGSLGPKGALIFAVPPMLIGIIIALVRIAEMTFLPAILNYFRLQLNNKERMWSMGTDSYSDIEIGYVIQPSDKVDGKNNLSLESKMNEEVSVKIGKL